MSYYVQLETLSPIPRALGRAHEVRNHRYRTGQPTRYHTWWFERRAAAEAFMHRAEKAYLHAKYAVAPQFGSDTVSSKFKPYKKTSPSARALDARIKKTPPMKKTRRFYVAIQAAQRPKFKGAPEIYTWRYGRRGENKRLYVWFFETLNGPGGAYAFRKRAMDSTSKFVVAGTMSDLPGLVTEGRTPKGSKPARKTARARPRSASSSGARGSGSRGSSPKRGARTVKLAPKASGRFKVPAAVRKAAKEGLALYKAGKGGKGLTSGAITRARSLARGTAIDADRAKMMRAWFARHVVDRRPGWAKKPTHGYVAWQLWGGDAGRSWVKGIRV